MRRSAAPTPTPTPAPGAAPLGAVLLVVALAAPAAAGLFRVWINQATVQMGYQLSEEVKRRHGVDLEFEVQTWM